MSKYTNFARKMLTQSVYRKKIVTSYFLNSFLSDEKIISKRFKHTFGYDLDLDNPKTLNEKLQWIKLYDRNPIYTLIADKYLVRNYIEKIIGKEYLIPLLAVYKSPSEIDFESLPDQFVLKCNHNSGLGMCICRDKRILDKNETVRELKKGLKQNYYKTSGREWPYKNISRKIICEKYIENEGIGYLLDYKLQCFNGKFDSTFVCVNRFSEEGVKYFYFDKDWNYLPYINYGEIDQEYLDSFRPKRYEKMIEIAELLSQGFPELRVDLYVVEDKIYFGELTLFSQSGFDTDITRDADLIMGSKITLPIRESY